MQPSPLTRRALVTGSLGLVTLAAAACSGSDDTSTATSTSSASTSSATTSTSADSPDLATLVSQVQSRFSQETFEDTQTGETLPYNLFVPADHDASTSYPLVLYIADSSLVGQDVTAPLSQYGALIWASDLEQAKHEAIVVVPEYPAVIIDDHGSFTTTEYVEMTARLLTAVAAEHGVDTSRIYGTGQSMGCMTILYLAAEHPDLFAAELFVSGQWDVTQLSNLAQEKFFYIAAGGDSSASGGQTEVEQMLTTAGVPFQTATWDATWSSTEFADAAAKILAAGDDVNFATFATGTVLEVAGTSTTGTMTPPTQGAGGGTPPTGMAAMPTDGTGGNAGGGAAGGSSEHMASFEPAYKITALRDWLFAQTA